MISFIVPLQYKNEKSYLYKRALYLIKIFKNFDNGIELIIADSSKYKKLSEDNKFIQILNLSHEKGIYSPAKARNKSIDFVNNKYIFFLDVDLLFSETFIDKITQEVKEKLETKQETFLMFPCLYLSKEGNKTFEGYNSKTNAINFFREDYLLGNSKLVLRLAINSSAIIVSKEYFKEIGMFNEDFEGHGGEDFELLHRLASFSPHSSKQVDYYNDVVSQHIADYQGFRQYLAYYSLPYFFTDMILVHQWHERELFNPFYLRRVKNENLLVTKMREYDKKYIEVWKNKNIAPEYNTFLKQLQNKFGYPEDKYCGLFHLNEFSKIKSPISSKIRKFITKPNLFFKDMLKKYK